MIDTGMTFVEWLPTGAAATVLIGSSLVWLARRSLSLIELWMILRSLPPGDRVTAAVAFLTSRSPRYTGGDREVELIDGTKQVSGEDQI